MAETLMEYRLWVLRHWESRGWAVGPDRVTMASKGRSTLAWLRKKGLLEEDPEYVGMHRITDSGRDALAQSEVSM